MCHRYNTTLFLIDEPFTSKLCSHCGFVNYQLGSSSIFVCPNPFCQRVFDRDIAATYNIDNRFEVIQAYAISAGHGQLFNTGGQASFNEAKQFNNDLYESFKDRVTELQPSATAPPGSAVTGRGRKHPLLCLTVGGGHAGPASQHEASDHHSMQPGAAVAPQSVVAMAIPPTVAPPTSQVVTAPLYAQAVTATAFNTMTPY